MSQQERANLASLLLCAAVGIALPWMSAAPSAQTVVTCGTPPTGECETVRDSAVQSFDRSPYVDEPDEFQYLTLHMPATLAPCAPTVIWLHSGGWTKGLYDPVFNDTLCYGLATNGIPVINAEYYLSTYKPCPNQGTADYMRTIQDVKLVIDWIRDPLHGVALGLPQEIVVAGSSAGGHLAAMMSVTQGPLEKHFDPVEGNDYSVELAVLFSPPLDLVRMGCEGIATPSGCNDKAAWGLGCTPPCVPLFRHLPTIAGYPCVAPPEVCVSATFQETLLGRRWNPTWPPLTIVTTNPPGGTVYTCSDYPPEPPMPTKNRWFDASPYFWVGEGEGPIHIIQSKCDGWVSSLEGNDFQTRVCAKGGRCTVATYSPPLTGPHDPCDVAYKHAAESFSPFQAAGMVRDVIEQEWSAW